MMSPRRPIAAFLIFVSSLVLAVPGWASETVKLGDLPAISNAGIYIAMDKGYFQEHGVTVDAERFASAGKMTAPLATGQIDVSVGSPSAGLFNSIAGGMDFKIVADKYADGQASTGLNIMTDLITANPNLVGVFASNLIMAQGVGQAIAENKLGDKVKVIGFDSDEKTVGFLKEGVLAGLVVKDPYRMGYDGVKTALAVSKGEKVEAFVDTGANLVTKDNMADPKIDALLNPKVN